MPGGGESQQSILSESGSSSSLPFSPPPAHLPFDFHLLTCVEQPVASRLPLKRTLSEANAAEPPDRHARGESGASASQSVESKRLRPQQQQQQPAGLQEPRRRVTRRSGGLAAASSDVSEPIPADESSPTPSLPVRTESPAPLLTEASRGAVEASPPRPPPPPSELSKDSAAHLALQFRKSLSLPDRRKYHAGGVSHGSDRNRYALLQWYVRLQREQPVLLRSLHMSRKSTSTRDWNVRCFAATWVRMVADRCPRCSWPIASSSSCMR